MHEMDYTVTLTAKDLEFRKRARSAGIPSMVVSMYAGALQKLIEDEREACRLIVLDNSDSEGICCTDDVLEAFRQRGEK